MVSHNLEDRFNSTTVQLIPADHVANEMYKISFNSTTVQLIRSLTNPAGSSDTMFQFHNGTINTKLPVRNGNGAYCFNSTTVQLILSCFLILSYSLYVSIPQRYN